jgi:hypothetical protein
MVLMGFPAVRGKIRIWATGVAAMTDYQRF